MNDMKKGRRPVAKFPVTAEVLENPAYRHRYYDECGRMFSIAKIRRNEKFWRSLTPPILKINKN